MDGGPGGGSSGGWKKVIHKIKVIAKKKKVFQTTLICSAGSRELRKGMSRDYPPIFKDPQDYF